MEEKRGYLVAGQGNWLRAENYEQKIKKAGPGQNHDSLPLLNKVGLYFELVHLSPVQPKTVTLVLNPPRSGSLNLLLTFDEETCTPTSW